MLTFTFTYFPYALNLTITICSKRFSLVTDNGTHR